ncbi:MAG: hypothetical protein ACRERD_21550 [Candidatus Binatia bacterium]
MQDHPSLRATTCIHFEKTAKKHQKQKLPMGVTAAATIVAAAAAAAAAAAVAATATTVVTALTASSPVIVVATLYLARLLAQVLQAPLVLPICVTAPPRMLPVE